MPGAAGVSLPPIDSTMWGGRRMPPLAIAEYAAAICIGVTDSPWPNGRLAIDEPEYCDQRQDDAAAPRPGGRRPVCAPNPNRRTQ